ncbi:MAG: hypothetical protein OER04_09190 [Cyclobacteriaceae bacterium]|nr:hypothetical protein [Cyclobacteriaceae bacterium]
MNSPLLFPQDKNYILKEAQEKTKSQLLTDLAESARIIYLQKYNPLGLEDDTIKAIKSCRQPIIENLDNFYSELAGVYRYKIGSNQLEFIFSGKSHYEKYLDDWKEAFELWVEDFSLSPYFIRAVLEATILQPKDRVAYLASNRLKVYLSQYFQLKVYKYRGILPTKAA